MKKLVLISGGIIVFIIVVAMVNGNSSNQAQVIPDNNQTASQETPAATMPPQQTTPLTAQKSPVKSSPAPAQTSPSFISLKNAELNYDKYSATEATIQGVVFNLIPSSFAPMLGNGNEVMIADAQDHIYTGLVFNVDSSAYQNINLGDIIQITGLLRGGGGAEDRGIQLDGNPTVVGHDSDVPSPTTVLNDATALIQIHQTDIQNALQSVNNSASFQQCAQINDTLINGLCSMIGGWCVNGGGSLPYVYKDSNALINSAVESVVNACTQKFYSNLQ